MIKQLFLLLFLSSVAVAGSDVTATWDANSEADLKGYNLYQSGVSGEYNDPPVSSTLAGVEQIVIKDIPDGTYYWVLTAYDNQNNESGHSEEVSLVLDSPPGAPQGFDVTVTVTISVTVATP